MQNTTTILIIHCFILTNTATYSRVRIFPYQKHPPPTLHEHLRGRGLGPHVLSYILEPEWPINVFELLLKRLFLQYWTRNPWYTHAKHEKVHRSPRLKAKLFSYIKLGLCEKDPMQSTGMNSNLQLITGSTKRQL